MRVTTLRSDGCLGFLLAAGKEAAVIDPTRDTAKHREALARDGLALRFVIDTHTHADHLSGARKLADETGARLVMSAHAPEQWRAAEGKADALGIGNILRANAGVRIEQPVKDGDSLEIGGEGLRFHEAPGHTLDSLVVLGGNRAFTGDTLLIGQTGRADLPGGDAAALHHTLFQRLGGLPDETFVYPGHDYRGQSVTALGLERANNPFLAARPLDEFRRFLADSFPSLTGAGMQCGAALSGPATCSTPSAPSDPWREQVSGTMDRWFFGARRPGDRISSQELWRELQAGAAVVLVDVREPAEYEGGHIEGSRHLPIREIDQRLKELDAAPGTRLVTVCRSGQRSGWAAMFLRVAGYHDVRSLDGGVLDWSRAGLPLATGGAR